MRMESDQMNLKNVNRFLNFKSKNRIGVTEEKAEV